MNSLVLLLICVAILVIGYIFYGGWLCKQWGVGEGNKETPAHTMEDGVDYVPAKAPVLMGHHFSSIAGAGPITGPIGAAIFGWLPVALWILVGGIFFGGVHDFGALFASVRNKGMSIGEIISTNMSKRAKRLFIIFSYLTLILVVAAFASIVATTFGAVYDESGAVDMVKSATPASVAMISLLFIVVAIAFGFCVYRRSMPMGIASVIGVLAIVAIMAIIVVIGSLSSCIMFQPRIEYAMAKDNLFFKSFAKVHPKYETPYFSIIVQCAVAIVLIFASNLSALLGYFTMVALLKNVLTFGTIFVLRKKGKEHGYNPSYKCPGGPIMPLIAIIMTGTLIWGQLTYAPMQSLICAFVAVVTGLPVFYYWDRKNKKEIFKIYL